MRKIFIIAAFLVSVLSYSQDPKDLPFNYHCIVRVSPLNFIWSNFQIGLEVPFDISHALLMMPNITYNQSKTAIGMELQYKYYVINKFNAEGTACNKYYAGFYGMYKGYSYDNVEGNRAGGGGVLVGYNHVFSKRFHIDMYVGGGIRVSDGNGDGLFDIGYKGIVPRLGIDFGINY